jgi:hypothetical protein
MTDPRRVWELEGAELDLLVAQAAQMPQASSRQPYKPSSDWADGGPIVEQQQISLWRYPDLDSWHACLEFDFVRDEGLKTKSYCQGPTPLIAAMRCFVASKLWQVPEDKLDG